MGEKANAISPKFLSSQLQKSYAIFYVLTDQKSKKFENRTGSVLLESTPPFFNFFISDLILLKNHQFHFEFLEHFQRILFQHFLHTRYSYPDFHDTSFDTWLFSPC